MNVSGRLHNGALPVVKARGGEFERALEVERYRVLDTQPEDDFDALAELAAAICGTPIALISIVHGERQWFKARVGTSAAEFPRSISFCAHAVLTPHDLLVVPDARQDARFATNPLVTGEPFVRFYAGMPIVSRDGFALGSVCVVDVTPRTLSQAQRGALKALAKQASALLELRRNVRELEARRETANNHRLLDAYCGDVVLFVRRSDARIVDASPTSAAAYGYARERLCTLAASDLGIEQTLPGTAGSFREALHRRSDGSAFPVEVAAVATTLDGEPVDMLVVRDIADRKERESQTARYRLIAERARDIILFGRHADKRILEANAAACAAYGYTAAEIRTIKSTDLRAVAIPPELEAAYSDMHGDVAYESVHRRKDGSTFPVEATVHVTELDGECVLFAIIRDISERVKLVEAAVARERALQAGNAALSAEIAERRAAEARLEHASFHDELTGLPNRALFLNRLKHTIARQQRHADHLSAIVVLDVDRFKSINDSLGHVVGDLVLTALAERLRRCMRTGDTLARLGGDEFSILLDGIPDELEATRFAERILRKLKAPFAIEHHGDVFVAASIGIVVSNTGYDLADDLMRSADVAMYHAKAQGKQRFQLFRPELLTRAAGLLQLETDLNLALEREQFRLVYQPIVSLADGAIEGFEALLRWDHPERGEIAPNDFILVAEETGIIVPLGEWVLAEACRQVRRWHVAFPTKRYLTVNVNVSGKQISSPAFLAYVRETLSADTTCAANVEFEITETALMTVNETAVGLLRELHSLGIPVHLDDFGTGYSSLSYLNKFSVDTLKIDRSFVSGNGAELANAEIVAAVVALAHSLSMGIVAEGIETREQLESLRALGCERGQGYYFARPLDAAAATAAIAAGVSLGALELQCKK